MYTKSSAPLNYQQRGHTSDYVDDAHEQTTLLCKPVMGNCKISD